MSLLARACVFGCAHTLPCPVHTKERTARARPEHSRGYDSQRWRRTSTAHLRQHPRCGDRAPGTPSTTDSLCQQSGRVNAATVTDHIVPHRGDTKLFWARDNRQSLCHVCHGLKSKRERQSPTGRETRGGGSLHHNHTQPDDACEPLVRAMSQYPIGVKGS